jgi:glycosyltransferase involved in cell wall biosynthesis
MRLLFISNVFPTPVQPSKGPFNAALVQALSSEHEVAVICPIAWTDEWQAKRSGRTVPEARRASVGGVAVHYPRFYFTPKVMREYYGWFMWRSVCRVVREQINSFKPDAVIGYWAHPDGHVAVRAARLAGVPAAVMVGGSDVLVLTQGRGRRERVLDVLRDADAIIAVSEDIKAKLADFGISAEMVHVVPRGVDSERFHPGSPVEAKARLNVTIRSPILLWVGRMVPVKGLDVLIDACAKLRSDGIAFHQYLVGDGPLRAVLEQRAVASGVSDAITFVGNVAHTDLPDWYRVADLTVLPSHSEGVPNVLRESLACGTPFVASRVGGIPEIASGTACKLVPPGDADQLASAIAEALSDAKDGSGHSPLAKQGSWAESARAVVRVLRRSKTPSRADRSTVHAPALPPPLMNIDEAGEH